MSKIEAGTFGMLTEAERERLLKEKLERFRELQLEDIRQESRSMAERFEALKQQSEVPAREVFTLSQFMPHAGESTSSLLQEAIKYFETHDGCPFHETDEMCARGCATDGVWVRMGHPCWEFVERVKEISKAFTKPGNA